MQAASQQVPLITSQHSRLCSSSSASDSSEDDLPIRSLPAFSTTSFASGAETQQQRHRGRSDVSGLPESAEAWQQGREGQALESEASMQQLGTTRRIVQQLAGMERQGRQLHTLLLPTHLLERQASQDSQVRPEPVLLPGFACHVAHCMQLSSWERCVPHCCTHRWRCVRLLATSCAGGRVRCFLGGCPATQQTAQPHCTQQQQRL